MSDAMPRLGDLIDDHCPRCRLVLNHAIASLMNGKVAKVICQTCLTEHPFLHEDGTKKKKSPGGRETLFDQVLAHGSPVAEAVAVPPSKKKAATPARKSAASKEKARGTRRGS